MNLMSEVEAKSAFLTVFWAFDRHTRKRLLEDMIAKFRPDGMEAEELLHALFAGLGGKEKLGKSVKDAFDDLCEVVVDLDDSDPENPFNGPDEMDLSRQRRQAAEAI